MSHDPADAPTGASHTSAPAHPSPRQGERATPSGAADVSGAPRPPGRLGVALTFAILSALITHGYHIFTYPLYSTDEGIYAERAWAVLREGQLSPQTYYYDHAPGGWLLVAFWEFLLPGHFEMFGNPINSGRALMLLLHVASVYFLFQIARKFSGGSLLAPTIACFFFNFSPLGIYYQRMVLLDNIMVFWFLLSIHLLVRREGQLFAAVWSGLAFGISVVTKENAIFFAPSIFYLLSWRAKGDPNRRFALMLWTFASSTLVLIYSLFATLKGELLPTDLSFDLSRSPQGHVSLLYEMWFQLHRNQGTLFSQGSFLYSAWLPKDPILLAVGTAAMLISLRLGWRDRQRDPTMLVAATLALEIAFYLVRGSVLLDFYVIPLVPLYALNVGLVADRVRKGLPQSSSRLVPAVCVCVAALLMLPVLPGGRYLIVHGQRTGQLQAADVYYLPLTYLQQEQIAWIRQNIPPGDKVITDDDIWVDLHDVKPYYPYAQSHWNASTDPQVRTNIFGASWQNIDYIVLSNGMRQAMILNNGGGEEAYILDALDNHSSLVWQAGRGNVELQIYRVNK
jgi:4-amino-4-deoxy-L-arabinose transferase-like glycosyltransferase